MVMKPKKNEFTLAGFFNGVIKGNPTPKENTNKDKKKEEKKDK